jgi:outer membrane protein TolC
MTHRSREIRWTRLVSRSAGGVGVATLLALGSVGPTGGRAAAQSSEPLTLDRLFVVASYDEPQRLAADARAEAALALIDLLERTEVRRVHYQELEQLDALLRSVTVRAEAGELTRTDVEVVRTRRESANARATAASGERDAARERIVEQYGLPAESPQAASLQMLLASVPADLETAMALVEPTSSAAGPRRRAQVAQDWARMKGYLGAKTGWARAREAVEQAFDGAVEESVVGLRTTEDVLEAREQITRVRLEMAENEYDYWRSVVALLGSVGAFGAAS